MSDVPLDPQTLAMLEQLLGYGGGVGPSYTSPELNNILGLIPQGGTLNQNLNQLQDVVDLAVDPLFQAFSGPDAYSREAFQPTVTWETVESPEYTRFNRYLASLDQQDTFEGLVADELKRGGTASSAISKMRQKIASDPEGQLAQLIQNSVYGVTDEMSPEGGYVGIDWNRAIEDAQKIEEMYAAIPPLGQTGPTMAPDGTVISEGGEVVETVGPNGEPILLRRVEEPSPLAEKFRELGMPSPYEEYTTEDFVSPEWTDEPYLMAAEEQDLARQAMLDAYNEMVGFTPQAPQQGDWEQWGGGPAEREEEVAGGGGPQGNVAAATPGYNEPGVYSGAGGAPAIDTSGEIPNALESAILNRTDRQWMEQNWDNLSQTEQTNLREVLASYGLSPQIYGIEVQEPTEGGRELNILPSADLGEVTEGAFHPGEVTAQLEGVMTTPGGAEAWLAGNFARLSDEEQTEARQTLANYGLTVEDLMPQGTQVQGLMGPMTLGPNVPGLPEGRVAPRGGANPAYEAMWSALAGGGEPPSPPGAGPYFPIDPNQRVLPPYAQPGAQQARQPGDYYTEPYVFDEFGGADFPSALPPYAQPGAQQARQPGGAGTPGLNARRDAMLAAILPQAPINRQRQGPPAPGRTEPGPFPAPPPYATPGAQQARQPGDYGTPGVVPPYAQPGAQQARQPGDYAPGVTNARDAMLAAILPQTIPPRMRTGEVTEEEIDNYLTQTMQTGERRQRGRAEREAMARANAPQGLQGERYEAATGMGGGNVIGRRGVYDRRRKQFREAWANRINARRDVYGGEWAYAKGMADALQAQGVTPLQQAMAARIQNVSSTGVPIGARPGLY